MSNELKKERKSMPLETGMKEPIGLKEIQSLILKMMILDGCGKSLKKKDGLKIIIKHDEIEKADNSGIVWTEQDSLFHYAELNDKSIKVRAEELKEFAEIISPVPNLIETDENYGISSVVVKTSNHVLRLRAISSSNVREN